MCVCVCRWINTSPEAGAYANNTRSNTEHSFLLACLLANFLACLFVRQLEANIEINTKTNIGHPESSFICPSMEI